MKNNLADLNDHLFAMLEALNNDEEMEDPAKLDLAVKRAKAMCSVSGQILNVSRTQVAALKTAESCGLLNSEMPALLETKDSKAEMKSRKKALESLK